MHLTEQAAALGRAGSCRSARTTTARHRPASTPTCGRSRAASDLPVIVYDIPVRTGRKINTASLLRLAREVPNIVGLKDAAGNPGETAALISSAPAGFEVYSGDDLMTLPLMASGIVGTVGVATHWTGRRPSLMFDLWEKGDTAAPDSSTAGCSRASRSRPATMPPTRSRPRRCMRHLGLAVGQARLPMGDAPAFVEQRVPEVLANLQRWRDAFPDAPSRPS